MVGTEPPLQNTSETEYPWMWRNAPLCIQTQLYVTPNANEVFKYEGTPSCESNPSCGLTSGAGPSILPIQDLPVINRA